jgi:hypothetical protein
MAFNPNTALEYARSLSFPRRVGSEGERRALAQIRARLEAAGYTVEAQAFEASTGAEAALALFIGTLEILIVLTLAAWTGPAWLSAVPAAALLGGLALAGRVSGGLGAAVVAAPDERTPPGWKGWLRRLGHRRVTHNLMAHLHVEAGTERPRLILMAHWDSKSQAMALWVRMALITAAGTGGMAFAALSLARVIWPGATSIAAVCGLLALVAGLPVLFLYLQGSGNGSPGAVDNASGAGLLLHLAQVLRETPRAINVTFLFTGAEEWGLQGATAFVRAAHGEGGLAQTAVLNLDGVGTDGRVAYVGRSDSRLARLARSACAELGWPARRLALGGALFDHTVFAEAGADAISLITTGAAAQFAHTPRDDADKLSAEGLRRTGEIVLRVVSGIELEGAPGGGVEQGAR